MLLYVRKTGSSWIRGEMRGLSRWPTRRISSPTRTKSHQSHRSRIDATVTPRCPVMTRSSAPGSTAQATSPGFHLPPPHRLWCQKDDKAKSVTELQPPPRPIIGHLWPVSSHHRCNLCVWPFLYFCINMHRVRLPFPDDWLNQPSLSFECSTRLAVWRQCSLLFQ